MEKTLKMKKKNDAMTNLCVYCWSSPHEWNFFRRFRD